MHTSCYFKIRLYPVAFTVFEVMGNVRSSYVKYIWDDDRGRHMFFSKTTSSLEFYLFLYYAWVSTSLQCDTIHEMRVYGGIIQGFQGRCFALFILNIACDIFLFKWFVWCFHDRFSSTCICIPRNLIDFSGRLFAILMTLFPFIMRCKNNRFFVVASLLCIRVFFCI